MASDASAKAVGKLAKGGLFARLFGAGKQPLRLTAVPRDHVAGERAAGDALLAGRLRLGKQELSLEALDFAALDSADPLDRYAQGFEWLRDLAAAASREKGARLAEAVAGKWLVAHGARPDAAWAPALWGVRILFWTAYAPYVLSSRDPSYRSALLNTLARGARHLEANADKAPAGLDRISAWAGALVAALTLQGGLPRLSKAEGGLMRALASAQYDDGGLMSRSPAQQAVLVDRLGLVRAAYSAAKQAPPDAFESAAAAALAALHGVTMGDGTLSSWQGGNPGDAARLAALVDGCGLRARPLRAARGWGYQRMSALGSVVVVDAAAPPPARLLATGCASTLALEFSDGAQRLVVNCGGPGLAPADLSPDLAAALRTTAAHSTLVLDDTNSTAIGEGGALGRGVGEVTTSRDESDDASRLEASHDGYVRKFGLVHQRRLTLGNDGKELRGDDRLLPKGRRKIREAAPYAIRFHLAPGVEPTVTADGMGAILRSAGAPPWNFRCRGAMLQVEESLHVDGRGRIVPTYQLVVVGEVSGVGGDIGWQFRRAS
ncbi:heparinase II/III family protein [Sphingomonas sp. ASV193]|uniref:heparinase II/III family protein n=1 Tax=Sphingomonas sp. ASV193 TaxID=3144405 RepID=UPI0032E9095B